MTTEKPLMTTPYCQRVRAAGIAARIRSATRRCVAARRARYVRLAGAPSRSRCGRAKVAELVDAHGSGPCGGNPVEVQVLSSAPQAWSSRERPGPVNAQSTKAWRLATARSPRQLPPRRTRVTRSLNGGARTILGVE